MLHFLTFADNRGPLRRYLRWWGERLRGRVRLVPYEAIRHPDDLPDGTYIFGDLERLRASAAPHVCAIHDALMRRGDRVRLLNRPAAMLRRRELLRALHTRGINRFNVHDVGAPREDIRFPVFIRNSYEHTGPLSPLLADASALDAAVRGAESQGIARDDLLVVEFEDTRSDTLYRKFSVARVGNALLGQHVFFSRDWVVKGTTHWPPEHIREDEAFMADNPHAATIGPIFDLAGVDFGRIDYAVIDGAVQVWEINTVPTILLQRRYYRPTRLVAKQAWARRFNAALAALDAHSPRPRLGDRLASWRDLTFGRLPPP